MRLSEQVRGLPFPTRQLVSLRRNTQNTRPNGTVRNFQLVQIGRFELGSGPVFRAHSVPANGNASFQLHGPQFAVERRFQVRGAGPVESSDRDRSSSIPTHFLRRFHIRKGKLEIPTIALAMTVTLLLVNKILQLCLLEKKSTRGCTATSILNKRTDF